MVDQRCEVVEPVAALDGRNRVVCSGTMRTLAPLALLLASGCGWAASRTLIAPDTYEIRCGVASVCYAAASDECPNGYIEIDRQQWSTGATVNTQTYGPPEAQTTNVQVYDRPANLLTVRCNPAPGG